MKRIGLEKEDFKDDLFWHCGVRNLSLDIWKELLGVFKDIEVCKVSDIFKSIR